ncbi:hypothetical protein T03_10909 [Trichinella britovi]|uniref:Uncharacterized protein n=1 Tax=Trichinella britovi TaxID=45882 RepID=A0A0V1BBG1_TRIBR|nr:hypothetical protein T03_14941 [Trichinella britovi]KRY34278.1 hypothetical protein T03_1703 [Trichinella britovi]KRY36463.1 hypothetical protein T03_10909 [Trichinella britovi]
MNSENVQRCYQLPPIVICIMQRSITLLSALELLAEDKV